MKVDFIDDDDRIALRIDHFELLDLGRPDHRKVLVSSGRSVVERCLGPDEIEIRRYRFAGAVADWDAQGLWPASQHKQQGRKLEVRECFEGKGEGVKALCVSSDAETIVALLSRGSLVLIRPDLPKSARYWKTGRRCTSATALALASDGRHCAVGGIDSYLAVWDVDRGEEVRTFVDPRIAYPVALTFSRDRQQLHSLSSGVSERFDWDDPPAAEQEPAGGVIQGEIEDVEDGFSDPSTGRFRRAVFHRHVWDAETGEILSHAEFDHAHGAAFSADQASSIRFRGRDVAVHREAAGERLAFHGHLRSVRAVSFSADAATAISADDEGHVFVWDSRIGRAINRFSGPGQACSLACSPDRRGFAAGFEDGSLLLADLEGPLSQPPWRARKHEAAVTAVAVGPRARTVVSGDENGDIRVWDVRDRG